MWVGELVGENHLTRLQSRLYSCYRVEWTTLPQAKEKRVEQAARSECSFQVLQPEYTPYKGHRAKSIEGNSKVTQLAVPVHRATLPPAR